MQIDKSATLSTHNTQTLFELSQLQTKPQDTRAVAIPEIMMVQPMDWESENREHLPIHSQQPTAMQSHTQSTGQHSIKE